MNNKITVLCVDDEIDILTSLKRCFRNRDITIVEATNGFEAIKILEQRQIDIIITDMRMPIMDGVELLSQIYQRWPHVYRMLLTGYTDMQALADAVNQCKILSYIEKPWQNEKLNEALDTAIEDVLLQRQQADQKEHVEQLNVRLNAHKSKLEQRIAQRTRQVKSALHRNQQFTGDLYKVLNNFIAVHPVLDSGFATSVSMTARNFSNHLNLNSKQISEIELAGKLCEIGLLGLDYEIATTPFSKLNYTQQQLFYSQVDCIHSLLTPAQPLQSVEDLLTHQYENIDGSGYPKQLSIKEIPLGSRILSISRDFWRYKLGKITGIPLSEVEALKELKKYRGKRYDRELIDILMDNANILHKSQVEIDCGLDELTPGMVMHNDLYGHRHMLLLPRGHELTDKCIRKLKRLESLRGTKIRMSVTSIENLSLSETLN